MAGVHGKCVNPPPSRLVFQTAHEGTKAERRTEQHMDPVTQKLQLEAQRIASRHGIPAFYTSFKPHMALARRLYYHHPLVATLKQWVKPRLQECLGHGLYHCRRVSIEGAALVFAEMESGPRDPRGMERLMVLALLAGLLHDICRSQDNHAERGAREAAKALRDYPLTADEIAGVCQAIRNHEAFIPPEPCSRPWCQLLSDCLYDADKFRWGPDTFTHTLWYMVHQKGLTLQELIENFPWGISGVVRIKETFRTNTGKHFGPQIIESGVSIGREIYHYLIKHYREGENDQRHADGH